MEWFCEAIELPPSTAILSGVTQAVDALKNGTAHEIPKKMCPWVYVMAVKDNHDYIECG